MEKIFCSYISSPIGLLRLLASDVGLQRVQLVEEEASDRFPNQHSMQAAVQLMEYFEGDRSEFDLTLDMSGSDFFESVWKIVYDIPYGRTRSYMDIARQLNNPGAVRAVGMANGKNPIPIIVPCHRVIGSDGSLTGYASGLDIKRWLLSLENPKANGMQGNLFG